MNRTRATLIIGAVGALLAVASLSRQLMVFGQTPEGHLARTIVGEFLDFTISYYQYYLTYVKAKHREGRFVMDQSFIAQFAKSSSPIKTRMEEIERSEAAVFTLVPNSKIGKIALGDELSGRGLEFFGDPIDPSRAPNNAGELVRIFQYRLYLISELFKRNKDVTLGRQELFNFQAHLNSIIQIATAYQVVEKSSPPSR